MPANVPKCTMLNLLLNSYVLAQERGWRSGKGKYTWGPPCLYQHTVARFEIRQWTLSLQAAGEQAAHGHTQRRTLPPTRCQQRVSRQRPCCTQNRGCHPPSARKAAASRSPGASAITLRKTVRVCEWFRVGFRVRAIVCQAHKPPGASGITLRANGRSSDAGIRACQCQHLGQCHHSLPWGSKPASSKL